MKGGRRIAALAVAGALIAEPVAPSTEVAAKPGVVWPLELSGCDALTRDGACRVRESTVLHAWLPGAVAESAVDLDGAPLPGTSVVAVQGGSRIEVHPAARAGMLRVSTEAAVYTQRLSVAPPLPVASADARALRAKGDTAGAWARLEQPDSAGDGALGVELRAQIAVERGAPDDAEALFARASEDYEREGTPSRAADAELALVFVRFEARRFAAARTALARARELSRAYADGRAMAAYYEGLLAMATGSLRGALDRFAESADGAERLGMDGVVRVARQGTAAALDRLGRVDDALETLMALTDAGGDDGCDRAGLAATVGWVALHQRAPARVDAAAWLRRALATYRAECPTFYDPAAVANVLSDLARAELAAGDTKAAEGHVSDAEAAVPHVPPTLQLESAETRGDIALARGALAAARSSFDRMAKLAEAYGDRDARRIALQGRAEALVREGDRSGALLALAQVGEIVDAETASLAVGDGRESFVRARQDADAHRVELLLALGRAEEAFRSFRVARARVVDGLVGVDRVATLDAERAARWDEAAGAYRRARDAIDTDSAEDWRYSAKTLDVRRARRADDAARAQRAFDEAALALAPPRIAWPSRDAPGRLTLAYFAGDHGWDGFAAEAGHVHATALGAVDPDASPEAIAHAMLAPFADAIARAERVEIMAYGDARRVSVHALPWPHEPLVARVPVVYALDRASHEPAPSANARALLVGDTSSDLRGARVELASIAEGLEGSAWSVMTLRGSAATSGAVRDALGAASLFHYSGHARYAGKDGVTSALLLADGGALSLTDVLALPRVPARVLLFGCETARESNGAGAEGIGLANAFVLAGAREVVAATEPVGDASASIVARAVHARLSSGADLAESLRAAQREAWAQGVAGWEAFRVIVP